MIIIIQSLIFLQKTLLPILCRFLRPCYQVLQITFKTQERVTEEEEEFEEDVFAEYDEERGVVFSPPVYLQRYAAVTDCLMEGHWSGKLEKVLELGYNDGSFLKYMKEVPGVKSILGVDLDAKFLCMESLREDYSLKKDPLKIMMLEGNAADPDYRLIGCDAVISIEMIEHLLPHDLDRLVHTVFGYIKPWIAIFSTPNGDFNCLFRSMKANGFRRMDHFFEWSREQFNEWCGNIVVRYPDYSVTCRGVGPGPHGTGHIGCCSQMAIFVSKDYHKQPDLNPDNEVANISDGPLSMRPCLLSEDLAQNFALEKHAQPSPNHKRSSLTIVIPSPNYSLDSLSPLAYSDKTSQCNVDLEIAKSFMMTNDEDEVLKFTIKLPRRRDDAKVYFFEDVVARLNNTTYIVKKFSKISLEIMETQKRKHNKESMGELEIATEIFNGGDNKTENIWNNINWGDDAPPGNRYYKIVRQLTCPFQEQTEECLILDAVTEEINRHKVKFALENNIQLPLKNLMPLVQHITDDKEKVMDLLSWNGYQIEGDMVIHSQEDIAKNHDFSDLDTIDGNSRANTDRNTPHIDNGHGSLDRKLRKLRKKLLKDHVDIKLDRILCYLMKLTLQNSQNKSPPPHWLQNKIADLLSLTEKALERKRINIKHPLPLFGPGIQVQSYIYQEQRCKRQLFLAPDDTNLRRIEDEYGDLVKAADTKKEDKFADSKKTKDFFSDEIMLNFKNNLSNAFVAIKAVEFKKEVELEIPQDNVKQEFCVSVDVDNSSKSSAKDEQTSNCKESKQKSKSSLPKYKMKHKLDDSKMMKQVLRQLSKINEQVKGYCDKNKYFDKKKEVLPFRIKEKSSILKPISDSLKEVCDNKLNLDDVRNTHLPIVEEEDDNLELEEPQLTNNDRRETNTVDQRKGQSEMFGKSVNEALHAESSKEILTDFHQYEAYKMTSDSVHSQTIIVNESIHSQTILINDINEPSTSKGIRHVHTDVQCGSDSVYDLTEEIHSVRSGTDFGTSMNNNKDTKASISWTKIHKVGIFIKDSVTSIKTYSKDNEVLCEDPGTLKSSKRYESVCSVTHTNTTMKKSESFGMEKINSGNIIKSKIPKLKPTGIKINDFDTVIQEHTTKNTTQFDFKNNKNINCLCKGVDYKFDKNQNNEIKTYGLSQQVNLALVPTETPLCPTLSFVGAQVHSYKNSLSEDIIYQGMWQNHITHSLVQKKTDYSSVTVNKTTRQRIMRSKMYSKNDILPQVTENKDQLLESTQREHNLTYRITTSNSPTALKKSYFKKNTALPVSIAYKFNSNKNYETKCNTKRSVNRKCYSETGNLKQNVNKLSNLINPKVKQNVLQSSSPVKTREYNNKNQVEVEKFKPKKMVVPVKEILKQKKPANDSDPKIKMCHINLELERTKSPKVNIKRQLKNTKKQIGTNKTNHGVPNSFRPKLKDISNVPKVNKDELNVLKQPVTGISKFDNVVMNKIEDRNSRKLKLPHLTARVEELTKQYLKFTETDPLPEVKYVLFCNEIKHKSSETDFPTPNVSNETDITRASSPDSELASTSSRDSVVTVKTIAPKAILNNEISKAELNIRETRTITKHYEDCQDIPKAKDTGKSVMKALFTGRNTNVQIAQIPLENPVLHAQGVRKSITMIKSSAACTKPIATLKTLKTSSKPENNNLVLSQETKAKRSRIPQIDLQKCTLISTHMSPECSTTSQEIQTNILDKSIPKSPKVSQKASVEKTEKNSVEKVFTSDEPNFTETSGPADNESKENFGNFSNKRGNDQNRNICEHANEILKEMKHLIEERIQYIDFISMVHESVDIGKKQIRESTEDSVKTAGNVVIKMTDSIIDSDVSSLKLSRESEDLYFADNELSSDRVTNTLNVASIKEIFGRRTDQLRIQMPDGSMPLMDFSGLSMNTQPNTSEGTDFVNLVDSETGSVAGVPRRATSEECVVSVSVRSSDSYATCELEGTENDDVISVPGWLFQLLTQHHQNEDGPAAVPPAERPLIGALPILDVNGNIVEAGAGDGRGIHSDRSWNSSGNGSSVSSSSNGSNETNSEEWLLVEPLNSTYETLQESESPSIASTSRNVEDEDDSLRGRTITPRTVQQSSDGDADVSSDVDTDADVNSDVLNPADN